MAQARVPVTFTVEKFVHDNVERRARALGLKTSDYFRRLFEAAYAARIGHEKQLPVDDADLDRQVRAVMCLAGDFSSVAIAKALGLPESLVDRALKGFRMVAVEPTRAAPVETAVVAQDDEGQAAPKASRRGAYSPEEVETIRRMWAEGATIRTIAAAIGRKEKTVGMWTVNHRDVCPKRVEG